MSDICVAVEKYTNRDGEENINEINSQAPSSAQAQAQAEEDVMPSTWSLDSEKLMTLALDLQTAIKDVRTEEMPVFEHETISQLVTTVLETIDKELSKLIFAAKSTKKI